MGLNKTSIKSHRHLLTAFQQGTPVSRALVGNYFQAINSVHSLRQERPSTKHSSRPPYFPALCPYGGHTVTRLEQQRPPPSAQAGQSPARFRSLLTVCDGHQEGLRQRVRSQHGGTFISWLPGAHTSQGPSQPKMCVTHLLHLFKQRNDLLS